MKNMKKVLFLMLFLVVLGAANVNSQVRIGGDGEPNDAAILDLNADNDTNTGTKGLALPRVSLASNNDKLGYSGLLEGLLVYNTNEGITGGVGVYYWDGGQWVKPAGGSVYTSSTSIVHSGTSFLRAELTGDVIAEENSNETVISAGAVTTDKLANAAVTSDKLAAGSVSMPSTQLTRYLVKVTVAANATNTNITMPSGCDNTNSWFAEIPFNGNTPMFTRRSGTGFMLTILPYPTVSISPELLMFCFH